MQQNKAQNTFAFSIAGLESELTFRATTEPLNPERIKSFVLPESLQLMIFADRIGAREIIYFINKIIT
jgi:hypothetical protein